MTEPEITPPNMKIVGTLIGILGMTIGFVPSYFIAATNTEVLRHEILTIQNQLGDHMKDRYGTMDAQREHDLIRERDAVLREAIKDNAAQIEKLEALLREHVSERKSHTN